CSRSPDYPAARSVHAPGNPWSHKIYCSPRRGTYNFVEEFGGDPDLPLRDDHQVSVVSTHNLSAPAQSSEPAILGMDDVAASASHADLFGVLVLQGEPADLNIWP